MKKTEQQSPLIVDLWIFFCYVAKLFFNCIKERRLIPEEEYSAREKKKSEKKEQ